MREVDVAHVEGGHLAGAHAGGGEEQDDEAVHGPSARPAGRGAELSGRVGDGARLGRGERVDALHGRAGQAHARGRVRHDPPATHGVAEHAAEQAAHAGLDGALRVRFAVLGAYRAGVEVGDPCLDGPLVDVADAGGAEARADHAVVVPDVVVDRGRAHAGVVGEPEGEHLIQGAVPAARVDVAARPDVIVEFGGARLGGLAGGQALAVLPAVGAPADLPAHAAPVVGRPERGGHVGGVGVGGDLSFHAGGGRQLHAVDHRLRFEPPVTYPRLRHVRLLYIKVSIRRVRTPRWRRG